MNSNKDIENLIEKYFNGETSLEEEKQLQVFFQGEDIPVELRTYQDQFLMAGKLKDLSANSFSDDTLFSKLEKEVNEVKVIPLRKEVNPFMTWSIRVAAAAVLILVGFWVGGKSGTNSDVEQIQQELALLKSQLQSNSASGRLQAVSNVKYTQSSNEELVLTLETVAQNDPNMHVRTKAIEALAGMGNESGVLEFLSGALLEETEPAVQIAIIEALVGLQQKTAIESLEKLTEEQDVLKEVKDEAYIGIFKLKDM